MFAESEFAKIHNRRTFLAGAHIGLAVERIVFHPLNRA